MNWKKQFQEILPMLGHRNWILIVDKAYPMQSAEGIQTIYTGEKMMSVLKHVLKSINNERHTRPICYTDKEFLFMRDDLSRGAESLKAAISQLLSKQELQCIPHDEVFAKLDAASKLFQVIVLKTDCMIPYSSVFIELDCGYWSADRENTLRERIS